MRCNECERGCSCHINPPCSFCTDHVECDMGCGKITCEPETIKHPNPFVDEMITVCPSCFEKMTEGVE